MNEKSKKMVIKKDISIKNALKQIGEAGEKVLFVIDDNNRLIGSVSDGDVRRWILKEGSILENVEKIMNRTPKVVSIDFNMLDIKKLMIKEKIDVIPIIEKDLKLVDILLWRNVFSNDFNSIKEPLKIPALIMAGGKGARMDPFTRILPKPLIPLGNKPVIEIILDNFIEFGCHDFYLTLNYKGKMIQAYFDNSEYNINFLSECQPCGTAGGIKLASELIDAPNLFVSNCDILIKADYHDIYTFHIENNYDITIIGSMKHMLVPYGVLEVKNKGELASISEKPEYDFLVNTGMYLMKKSVISYIPSNTKFDFPDLIKEIIYNGGKIGVYPIGQHSWIDIGQWEEYHNALKVFDK